MKKLMVMGFAVAVAGAVQATVEPATYTFTANFHTTQGQPGKDVYTRYNAEMAKDANGRFWYNDINITNNLITGSGVNRDWNQLSAASNYTHLVWTTGYSTQGVAYPTLEIQKNWITVKLDDGTEEQQLVEILNQYETDFLNNLKRVYGVKSYGEWCGEFVWWMKDPAKCYRVWAPDAIEATITLKRDCCSAVDEKAFYNGSKVAIDFNTNRLAKAVFNRFSAQTAEDAEAYEIYAAVSNLNMAVSGLAFEGFLAGQGYRDLDGDYDPEELHGSIVGSTAAPVCPDCCIDPLPKAIAFECVDGTTPDGELRTAAYGTFRMVRNDQ